MKTWFIEKQMSPGALSRNERDSILALGGSLRTRIERVSSLLLVALGLTLPVLGQSLDSSMWPNWSSASRRSGLPTSSGQGRLSLGPSTSFPGIVNAPLFNGSFSNDTATSSAWATMLGANEDGTTNLGQSWGYNTRGGRQDNPSFPSFDLTIESNYFFPASAFHPEADHQVEAYLQFISPDGTLRRPWQVEIPFTGFSAYKTVMFTNTDSFSFLDETSAKQRVKISDSMALAHNVPLLFSSTPDCAGCSMDVGLEPGNPGQLKVTANNNGVRAFGNLIANNVILTGKLVQSIDSTNPSVGQVVLVNGTATVTTNKVSQGSKIFLSYGGAVGTLGSLYVAGIQPEVSFQIKSTSPTDDSPINYWILN